MIKKLSLIVACIALAFTVPTHAQSANAPIVVAPVSATVLKPATGTLTAAQVQALETALANAGITFSGGYVANINVRLTFKLQPSGSYSVTFYPDAPTN
jgi:hypothetical protein